MWILIILISSLAKADDYDAGLQRVQSMSKRADSILSRYGFQRAKPEIDSAKEQVQSKLFQIHSDLKSVRLPAGALAFGTLYTRLVVGGEESPVLINLKQTNKFGFLAGLKIMGSARQSGTEGRITIDFDRLLLSSGETVKLQASALDEAGAFGLQAQVFSSKALMIAGAMASSFLSGYASSQQTGTTTAFGFEQTNRSGRNSMLQGVSQTAADQSKRLIEDSTKEKPVLVVEPGTSVTVLFREEVRL